LLPEYRVVRTIRSPDHVVFDAALGRWRLSSKAFGPSSADGGLSVDIEQLLVRDGLHVLTMYPALDRAVAAAANTVAQLRAFGLELHHEPTRTNWYHGGARGKFQPRVRKGLAASCVELIPIDQNEARRLYELRTGPPVQT